MRDLSMLRPNFKINALGVVRFEFDKDCIPLGRGNAGMSKCDLVLTKTRGVGDEFYYKVDANMGMDFGEVKSHSTAHAMLNVDKLDYMNGFEFKEASKVEDFLKHIDYLCESACALLREEKSEFIREHKAYYETKSLVDDIFRRFKL